MSLFKKTIILTSNKTEGFLTLVKIGSSVGLKVVLTNSPKNPKLALKLKDDTFYFDITLDKWNTEIKASDFKQDEISVLLLDDDIIVARGGKKDLTFETAAKAHYTKVEFTQVEVPDIAIEDSRTEQNAGDAGFDFFKPQTDKNFYIGIVDKIDELMTVYPPDDTLNNLIEGGRFVRVQYDDNEFYSVGTISVDDEVKYIVYAIEGLKDVLPPEETLPVADFLPTSGENGYWVIMQDASTGETIKKESL